MNATQRFHSLYLFGMFCTLPSIAILSIICTYMKLHIVWWWWRLVGWMACERYLNGNVAREKVCGNGGKMAAPQCQFSTDKIYWPKTQTISQFSASSLTHSHALAVYGRQTAFHSETMAKPLWNAMFDVQLQSLFGLVSFSCTTQLATTRQFIAPHLQNIPYNNL